MLGVSTLAPGRRGNLRGPPARSLGRPHIATWRSAQRSVAPLRRAMLLLHAPYMRCVGQHRLTRPLGPGARSAMRFGAKASNTRLRAQAAAASDTEERSVLPAVIGFVLHGARVGAKRATLSCNMARFCCMTRSPLVQHTIDMPHVP